MGHPYTFTARKSAFISRNTDGSNKLVTINYYTGTRIGFVCQTLYKAWARLAKSINISLLSALFSPYMSYDYPTSTFIPIPSREKGFSPLSQTESLMGNCNPVVQKNLVCPDAWNRSAQQDAAYRYITTDFFQKLRSILVNVSIYDSTFDMESAPVMQPYFCKEDSSELPQCFADIPESVSTPLNIVVPEVDTSAVIEVPESASLSSQVNSKSQPSTIVTSGKSAKITSTTAAKRGRPSIFNDSGRKQKKPKLTTTKVVPHIPTPPHSSSSESTPSIKDEDEIEPSTSSNLAQVGQHALDELRKVMEKNFACYDCSFQDLVDVHQDLDGEYISSKADLILTDPPYNSRFAQDRDNSDHDQFNDEDMERFVQFCRKVMSFGSHAHIFCSALQFSTWVELFNQPEFGKFTKVHDSDDSDVDGDEDEMEGQVFSVEPIPLHYTKQRGYYNTDPRLQRLSHLSVVEQAVHVWKNGMVFQCALEKINYGRSGTIRSVHPGTCNEMNNIPRVPNNEKIFLPSHSKQMGPRQMLRPEQKSRQWMMDIIEKFTKPGDLVVDPCAGTFSVAMACMLMPKHRKFVGCDKDDSCLENSMTSLVALFARQILNPNSDIDGTDHDKVHAKVLLRELDAIEAKRRLDIWDIPPGVPVVQTFPKYLRHFISQFIGDPKLYNCTIPIPWNRWKMSWKIALDGIPTQALRAMEAGALGLSVKPSTIKHEKAGCGVFAEKSFAEGALVGHYYGTFVYGNLGSSSSSVKSYGEGCLSVTKNQFLKYAANCTHEFTTSDGIKKKCWVVAAPWCVTRYINDCNYLPGDKSSRTEKQKNRRIQNCMFVQNKNLNTDEAVTSYQLLEVRTLVPIARGDEFFLDYGEDHIHHVEAD